MKAKLIKTEVNYILEDDKRVVIASTSLKKEGLSLSLKNCQAIERGYDLDELLNDYDIRRPFMRIDKKHQKMYKEGFQKALELMSDKKFSEGDLLDAWEDGATKQHPLTKSKWVNLLQSLQQTEWDVEVEMEFVEEEQTGTHLVWGRTTPKLDTDGCLILKRI